jgi:hypothetical protein
LEDGPDAWKVKVAKKLHWFLIDITV